MKRSLLPIILIMFISLPCLAKDKDLVLPNIFITDTTEAEEYIEPTDITLKGYAEYMEDAEAVYLKDDNDQFVLNLKVPQKITSKKLADEHKKILAEQPLVYSKYGAEEYQVIPRGRNSVVTAGGLSFGTSYDQEVDYAELEQTAGFFTKYDIGRFSVKTAYERTIGSADHFYYDNLYVAPEIRLNKVFSIKEVLTADISRNRKKAEIVLSINPLAYTKEDRLNLEFGAGQTYDANNELMRSKIRFNTRFKL